PKMMLTDAAVKRLKPPPQGQIDYFDPTYSGLSLRVSYKGRKTWTYIYRIAGEQKRLTLDTYPPMTVAQAHDAWRKARDRVRAGHDPAGEHSGSATDFKSVFEDWLNRDQGGNKSARMIRQRFERDVLPKWKAREITSIGRRDILNVI